MTGLFICDDLIFTSRVTATARAKGVSVTAVRSAEEALLKARQTQPACVIVDLHTAGHDLPGLMNGLREACPTAPRVVAYGSHVNKELLDAARAAGCDVVLPRGKFVKDLEDGLVRWLQPSQQCHADDADSSADERG